MQCRKCNSQKQMLENESYEYGPDLNDNDVVFIIVDYACQDCSHVEGYSFIDIEAEAENSR